MITRQLSQSELKLIADNPFKSLRELGLLPSLITSNQRLNDKKPFVQRTIFEASEVLK